MNSLTLLILVIVLLFPLYVVVLSAAAYVGRVWALRYIFGRRGEIENGGEKER